MVTTLSLSPLVERERFHERLMDSRFDSFLVIAAKDARLRPRDSPSRLTRLETAEAHLNERDTGHDLVVT